MSMPSFPKGPPIKIEDAASMILASIAMEELGFSHIINAEGEKLQYVLKSLPENCTDKTSIKEILEVNKSIKNLLDSILQNQMLLKSKLECAANIIRENKKHRPKPPKPCPPQPCKPSCCQVASYPGRSNQTWLSGKPLQWQHSDCNEHCDIRLAHDCKSITLKHGKCYSVSFSVDICPECRENVDSKISISVRLTGSCGKEELFIYHAPAARTDSPVTVSACGIVASTVNLYSGKYDSPNSYNPELSIVLLSPDKVFVKEAGISVTET